MASRPSNAAIDVVIETGKRRLFVSALAWPGWSRSVKTADGEEAALELLADYAGRYRDVARAARCVREFDAVAKSPTWRIVDRVPGDATTDFGAPSVASAKENATLDADAARRLLALLEATWAVLDSTAASSPASLRKGPRGGGRDRDAMVEHVVNAEVAYARRLGLRDVKTPKPGDAAAVDTLRSRIREALRERLPKGAAGSSGAWSPRYAVRRMAWHVMDHVWEMEDRSET
jgi:hypothetical protein